MDKVERFGLNLVSIKSIKAARDEFLELFHKRSGIAALLLIKVVAEGDLRMEEAESLIKLLDHNDQKEFIEAIGRIPEAAELSPREKEVAKNFMTFAFFD